VSLQAEPQSATKATRKRREPNRIRFPVALNVNISPDISAALTRARQSFAGLGYTDSDLVRLALFEWLSAKRFLEPSNGNGRQHP
jgi:hypothetical protein